MTTGKEGRGWCNPGFVVLQQVSAGIGSRQEGPTADGVFRFVELALELPRPLGVREAFVLVKRQVIIRSRSLL